MDDKLAKWIRWITLIKEDVVNIATVRDVRTKFNEIILNNSEINKDNLFYFYIDKTYYSFILSSIRRHDKSKYDSASLLNLLREIIDNPKTYTLNEYDTQEDVEYNRCGIIDVPQYADETGNYLNIELVKNDYSELEGKINNCCNYVDRCIAHLDPRVLKGGPKKPNEKEIDECIDIINSSFIKYNVILTRTTTETISYELGNWKSIFLKPWILEKK